MASESQINQAIDLWTQARRILNNLKAEKQANQTTRDNAVQRLTDLTPLIDLAQTEVQTAQAALKALL